MLKILNSLISALRGDTRTPRMYTTRAAPLISALTSCATSTSLVARTPSTPTHVGYATLRPTNMAEFDALWGAICSTNGANGRGSPVPAFGDSLTVNRWT